MKGKINNDGYLNIERAGRMRVQYCPWNSPYRNIYGDWCPHFGEIECLDLRIELSCGNGRMLCFNEFTDERR